MSRVKVVQIRVIKSAFFGVRGAFNQVVNLAVDLSLVQINLYFFSATLWLIVNIIQTDSQQPIARHDLGPRGRGTGFNCFGNDPLPGVAPANAIPGRRFMSQALPKVEHAGRHHQSSAGQHQPRPS